MGAHDVAVLGVGMHPWGKWGRNFVEYGIAAAATPRRRRAWPGPTSCSVGADTMRNAPRLRAGARSPRPRVQGAPVPVTRARGPTALEVARSRILAGLCDVALVVGADTTPKGFLAPVAGERGDDPDWLRFRLLGATNPTYFAFYARRRMDLYGATRADFARVKVKNAAHGLANPYARYRKAVTRRR